MASHLTYTTYLKHELLIEGHPMRLPVGSRPILVLQERTYVYNVQCNQCVQYSLLCEVKYFSAVLCTEWYVYMLYGGPTGHCLDTCNADTYDCLFRQK